jgi:glyoxylase-like metal-dependent hydrolase (beta-lactamase superfamily II)
MLIARDIYAQETVSSAEWLAGIGADVETIEVTTETVAPGLHVLFAVGGNVAVSIGERGVLVVDDQFPALVPKIQAAIDSLGGGDVDFVVNTHWHFDHTEGNPLFGESGSWIVSHARSRQMMTEDRRINLVNVVVAQPATPAVGLPVITYDDRMSFHFNGEQIDLLHAGPAHTAGDAAVIFRGSNAVHMGDVYNNRGYPFIDADNGGDLGGLIRFCEAVLEEIDADTTVIPGHGPIATHEHLFAYVAMLKTIRDRIAALVAAGASLDDVIAARPTAEWDEQRGNPALLINRAYASLTR